MARWPSGTGQCRFSVRQAPAAHQTESGNSSENNALASADDSLADIAANLHPKPPGRHSPIKPDRSARHRQGLPYPLMRQSVAQGANFSGQWTHIFWII